MTPVIWTIVAAAAVIITTIGLAVADICKRLDRITGLLARSNEMKHEDRTGEWRDRY